MLSIPNVDFAPFPKIPRLNRDVIITEKIDGTNALIFITPDNQIFAGSKNKWITIDEDNHGFAAFCNENKESLISLGPGIHRGEFYGFGINKNPHLKTTKRLALFNTKYITDDEWKAKLPSCCDVVPLLYTGPLSFNVINSLIDYLRRSGSGLGGKAEGVIIYHTASGQGFKVTCENDDKPKSGVES